MKVAGVFPQKDVLNPMLGPEAVIHFLSGANAGVLVLSNTVYSALLILPFK